MKLENSKHAHNLTKLLKVCLFGMLMLFPFLAMLPSTLYFAFNEHAQNYTHEEVIETYEYETNEVNSVDDLVVGNIYTLSLENFNLDNLNAGFSLQSTYIPINFKYDNKLQSTSAPSIGVYGSRVNSTTYRLTMAFINSNNGSYIAIRNTDDAQVIDFKIYFLYSSLTTDNNDIVSHISASDYLGEKNVEIVSSDQSPLNAFYSASNELWQQPMFNWVNTGLGSIAIANMLSVFGIAKNTFISNILIYWLSLTAIYIIIDIIIEAFTALTHLFTKKTD